MKLQLQLFLIIILIILSHCYNKKIISFPDNVNEYKIKTNDGFILLKKSQNSEHNLNYLYLIGVKILINILLQKQKKFHSLYIMM